MTKALHQLNGWFLFLLLFGIASRSAESNDREHIDPSWLDKARSAGKQYSAKRESLAEELEEVTEVRTQAVANAEATIPLRHQIRKETHIRLKNNALVEMTRTVEGEKPFTQRSLECDNAEYHFTLRKLKEDAPWALTDYGTGARKVPLANQSGGLFGETLEILNRTLASLRSDSPSTLKVLQWDSQKNSLCVGFETQAKDDHSRDEVYLDPRATWRVVERRVDTKSVTSTTHYQYGSVVNGIDCPSEGKTTLKYKVANAPPNQTIHVKVLSVKVTNRTPDSFRLSAFDLPEPLDAPAIRQSVPRYVWFMIAAGASALLAIGFTFLSRRKSKQP